MKTALASLGSRTLALLIVGISVSWGGLPAGADDSVSGAGSAAPQIVEPDRVLNALSEFYRGLSSFTVTTVTSVARTVDGETANMVVEYRGAMRRPGHFVMKLSNSLNGANVFCDGATLSIHIPEIHKYAQEPAPQDFSVAGASGNLGVSGTIAYPNVMEALLADTPRETLLKDATEVTYVGLEKNGDKQEHHVRMKRPSAVRDMWISGGKQPLLVRIRDDYSETLRGMLSPPPTGKVEMTCTFVFENWVLNAPIPDTLFTFVPPEGDAKYDSVEAMLTRGPSQTSPLLGKPAPPISLVLLDGGRMDLASHAGKDVVVIDFWATWCAPCVASLPAITQLLSEYKSKGVVFYAVNRQEDPAAIQAFLKTLKTIPTVALDLDSVAYDNFQVTGLPETFVVDKAGVVQAHHIGYSPYVLPRLRKELDEVLSGKSLVSKSG